MREQRDLSDLSDEDLVAELARRRAEGRLEMDDLAFELSTESGCAAGGGAGDAGVSGRAGRAATDRESTVARGLSGIAHALLVYKFLYLNGLSGFGSCKDS
jgi:hypothetical protein